MPDVIEFTVSTYRVALYPGPDGRGIEQAQIVLNPRADIDDPTDPYAVLRFPADGKIKQPNTLDPAKNMAIVWYDMDEYESLLHILMTSTEITFSIDGDDLAAAGLSSALV